MQRGSAKRVYRSRDFADLSQSPIPQWDLLDMDNYITVGVQYSRGCPHECDFCNVTKLLGRYPRTKSGAQIIAELESLYSAGWRGPVFFADDNLIGNKKAAREELLPALIEWQKRRGPTRLQTQASLNLADDPVMTEMMAKAGFDAVFLGIETPDAACLDECSKNQNKGRDLIADVRKLQRAGMEVQGGFIVGFDSDTPDIFDRQVEFIQRSGIVTAMVGILQAPPGTQLYRRLLAEGRLIGHSSGDNADGTTNVILKMGVERVRDGFWSLLERIYSPKASYQRLKQFIRFCGGPEVRQRYSVAAIRAGLRAVAAGDR